LKIFLDTSNIAEIREAASIGMLDGVTTNPTLIAKEGKEFKSVLEEICEVVPGPVNAEVVSVDYSGMVRDGKVLAKNPPKMVVKVPMIKEGLKAIRKLA